MTENLVPDEFTILDAPSVYAALRAAAPTAIGASLSRASALLLCAQIQEETGWRACHCWNLGNVKHVPGDGHDYCQFRCSEIVGGKEVFFDPPHPATSFRAYPSLAAACVDYLALLRKRFAGAWPSVLAGDPHGFVRALATAHYFTASEELYEKNVTAILARLSEVIPDDPEPTPYVPLNVAPIVDVSSDTTGDNELPPTA